MSKKQIATLFFCSLVPWTVGNGLVPLLPVYAARLGASRAMAGNYLAFCYFAIALGAVSSGWVSDRFHNRKLPIILAGLVGIPAAFFTGRAGSLFELSILTGLLWFCGGLGLGLIGILAGLTAADNERGKIFGILSLTNGAGALIGGLATGVIVDRWGFQALFTVVSLFLLLWPLSGLLMTEAKEKAEADRSEDIEEKSSFGRSYYLLLGASLVASIASFVIVLGRSLLMNEMAFNATAISITGAVSGIIALPIPALMGWLSDRSGRKGYLYLGYSIGIASLAILAISRSLWQFAIALGLQAIFSGLNSSVGNAFVTDLLPQKSLGKGLALFGASSWIGGILGFAGAGYALQELGVLTTFAISTCLPLLAILLLVPVRARS